MTRIILVAALLTGCATSDPDVVRSQSRDRTAENMAKAALIGAMLQSDDPVVRAKGADAASEFVKKEKRSIFDY